MGMAQVLFVDVVQLILLGAPAFVLARQGRLRLSLRLPESRPESVDWRPITLLIGLLSLYLIIAWGSVFAEYGFSYVLRMQGGT